MFSGASALQQIAMDQVPAPLIYGSEDNFVHTDTVYRMCTTPDPTKKQLLAVDGAGHGNSSNHAPDLYSETVFGFLDAHMSE